MDGATIIRFRNKYQPDFDEPLVKSANHEDADWSCEVCGGDILPGQDIRRWADSVRTHEDCPDASVAQSAEAAVLEAAQSGFESQPTHKTTVAQSVAQGEQ